MVFKHLRAPTKVFDPNISLGKPVFDSYMPLIHAMMVCHKWYVVASEKASLWTGVDYSRGTAGPNCLLKRSGTTPIHLRVILKDTRRDMATFPETVRANASRLRQLDVCMTGPDTMRTVEVLLANDMPLLQSLKLADEFYNSDSLSLRKTPGRFPSLRGLMLKWFFWLPAPEVGPFTKLTHLHLSMLSIPLALVTTFLDATPALEVLGLDDCIAMTLTELPTHTTTLEYLTHLTISRMTTRIAEVLMPALVLPRAAVVCLWLEVKTPPTDALLPQPQYWRDATRVRIDQARYGRLTVRVEAPQQRVALRLEYGSDGEAEDQPLWPFPFPTLAYLPSVTAAHLSVLGHWRTALRQFTACFPALVTLFVKGPVRDRAAAAGMVDALRDVLGPGAENDSSHVGAAAVSRFASLNLKEVSLVLPCAVPELTARFAPALRRRKRDGVPVERFGVCIVPVHEPGEHHAPEATMRRDMGDALAEYVEAGRVEHEEDAFWRWDEELWRQENEFWEVPRAWY